MKFTIESFKTHIYRPAEWMINNEKISHLIGDLNKQFSLSLEEFKFDSNSDSAGETFSIKVNYNNCLPSAKKFKISEIEILTVKFCTSDKDTIFFKNLEKYHVHYDHQIVNVIYDSVVFEDYFEKLINETNLPYWTAAALLKKINALVFKVLTDMQEYKELEMCNKEDTGPIVVNLENTETE